MGLDIRVLVGEPKKLADRQADIAESVLDEKYETVFTAWNDPVFDGRQKPLVNGAVYEVDGSWHFRAGSYSGYGRFRDMLAQIGHGKSQEYLWAEQVGEGPFIEQINFSDCEGVLGQEVAAKLAKDYEEFTGKAREAMGAESYEFARYLDFKRAFTEVAERGGAVYYC